MEMEEKQMNDKMLPMFKPAYEKEEVEEVQWMPLAKSESVKGFPSKKRNE